MFKKLKQNTAKYVLHNCQRGDIVVQRHNQILQKYYEMVWNLPESFLIGRTSCDVDIGDGTCPSCQVGKFRREQINDFMLYTCLGCVIRKQYAGICNNLGNFNEITNMFKIPLL